MKKMAKPAIRKSRNKGFRQEPEVYESTIIDKVIC